MLRREGKRAIRVEGIEYKGLRVVVGSLSKNHLE